MISYGGQANSDLAVTCTDQTALVNAYMAPIARYQASTIDLDIEGASLADTGADARRAQAIETVQQRLAAQGKHLQVWLTLPVSGQGLTTRGIAVARSLLQAHVNLTGVNAMAMDFGPGQGAARDLIGTVERSLYATHAQVQSLYRHHSGSQPGRRRGGATGPDGGA